MYHVPRLKQEARTCLVAEVFWIHEHQPCVRLKVVIRFLSSRFHPTSRRLFAFYFSNITLGTDLLTFRLTGAVVKIASEMRRLLAYFDNPESLVPLVAYDWVGTEVKNKSPFKLYSYMYWWWLCMFTYIQVILIIVSKLLAYKQCT